MSNRSEFKFVVDGVDLTDEQKVHIASAIQKAGLEALNVAARGSLLNPVTVGHINPRLRPEWYGLWVLDGPIGHAVGSKINDIGFYQ